MQRSRFEAGGLTERDGVAAAGRARSLIDAISSACFACMTNRQFSKVPVVILK